MTHYVYVAASDRLLSWSAATLGRFAIKVGESWNPSQREHFLSGLDHRGRSNVLACCGCSDWKVVGRVAVASEDEALDLEERFKASFEPLDAFGRHRPPFLRTDRGAGEGDLVLLPAKALAGCDLARLDADVRELYLVARSRMFEAVRAAPEPEEPHVGEEERARRDEIAAFWRDELDRRAETLDDAERLRETGSYYD